MKNFGLIGVGGFIAVRHLKAIKETGNNLLAALDKNDSVGIMDSYFPKADFFTEFERFDRHVDKLRRKGEKLDFVSICTPNYLHDSHIRFALRNNADAICEKPLVLNPWNVDSLLEIEKETGSKIYNILQLRLHQAIINLKNEYDSLPKDKIYDIDLAYITSRGNWYFNSWKADLDKSGGIATNIGIHFFDMLIWIFGDVKENKVHISTPSTTAGFMQLERARIRWFLSVDENTLPEHIKIKGQRTFRSIVIEDKELEFSEGFTDLHTESYKHILTGKGFRLIEAKPSINTAFQIRNATPAGLVGDYHPFCKKIIV